MFLEELTKPLSIIKGLGTESIKAFASMSVVDLATLIKHFPSRYEDRQTLHSLQEASQLEGFATTIIKVLEHDFIRTSKDEVLKVLVRDAEGTQAELLCFGRNFLQDKLVVGEKYFIYANFFARNDTLQTSSFDFEVYSPEPKNFLKLNPIYPLALNLKQGKVAKAIEMAMLYLPSSLKTVLPVSYLQKHNLPISKKEALAIIHQPANYEALERAMAFLKAEEVMEFQLVLQSYVKKSKESVRRIRELTTNTIAHLKRGLSFQLTDDQNRVIAEILADMQKPYPMRRLLQGDVGSGKTLVALCCAVAMIEQGYQVALLAPTELLAKQHAVSASQLLHKLDINVAFLSSNVRLNGRKELLGHLKNGDVHLVIGTHALFSNDVEYHNLGLAVIDEQHRFGVEQRSKLLDKGQHVDLLLMSATPIPRTLALSSFGDLEFSEIKGLPLGRKAIKTHIANMQNEQKVYDYVRGELEAGHQAYFVYPLIEESEEKSLRSAEAMYQRLQKEIYPSYKIATIHSKLDEDYKSKVMAAFKDGRIDILIATSVVEVGIDVPNATVMVIENAEQFGLATLHQLRGRVGRSDLQSYCFLVYSPNLTEEALARLEVVYKNSDGFVLAEKDLEIRGSGQILGDKQAGVINFKWLNLSQDYKLLGFFRDYTKEQFVEGLSPTMKEYLEFYRERFFARH